MAYDETRSVRGYGHHKDLNLDHVSAQGDVFGQQQEHVRAADITRVERRSIHKGRTTLLLVGVSVGVFFLIAIVAFASGDFGGIGLGY